MALPKALDPWALDLRVDATASKSHVRQTLDDLFLSDCALEEILEILQAEPARPLCKWLDELGPYPAPLAYGVPTGFVIPSPPPTLTPAR